VKSAGLIVLLITIRILTAGQPSYAHTSPVLSVLPVSTVQQAPDSYSYTDADSENDPDYDEAFLEFRFRSVVNTFITGWYKDETFYLPFSGLFGSLQIDYHWDASSRKIHGFFVDPDQRYSFDPASRVITLGDDEFQLTSGQLIVRDADFYLTPDVFSEVFGLDFVINFQRMTLTLTSGHILPVEQADQRRRSRERSGTATILQPHYDLRFGREKSSLDGMFLDYNLAWNQSMISDNRSGRFGYGAELLGGDIQGFFSFSNNNAGTRYENRDIRWRYAFDRTDISYLAAGEVYSRGLASNSFYGIQVGNEPIEPRRYFGDYQVQGFAGHDHDVELFVNGRLVSHMNAGETGYYNFTLPVTYGSALVNIRKYGPSGTYSETSRRVNVPASLLRPGEFTYHADAGWLSRTPGRSGFSSGDFMTQTSAGYGLNEHLTLRAGVEYFESSGSPVLFGSASARIFDQYLFTSDVVPGHFYRFSGNVQYPGFTSVQVAATAWDSGSIYNIGGLRNELQGSLFLPLLRDRLPLSLRLSASRADFGSQTLYQYDTGLIARYRRLNIQAGYRETLFHNSGGTIRQNRLLTGGLFYMFENRPSVPAPLRTLMVRAQMRYTVQQDRFESITLTIDRRLGSFGRFSTGVERNFARRGDFFFISLTFDFPQLRTSGNYRSGRNDYLMNHQVQGSVGYDSGYNRLVLDNRQNVGHAGAAIRMLITDGNGGGTAATGSSVIPAEAIRFRQTTSSRLHDDGVSRVTHLMPYTRYSIEIMTDRIKNPLLIPEFTEFSFVTDPNGFKQIDIPLVMAGEVDGSVTVLDRNGNTSGANGLRVVLFEKNHQTREVLPAYSDGTFYKLGVRPGSYVVYPDSMQLQMLDLTTDPPYIEFDLEALPEGDYAENLHFRLMPAAKPGTLPALIAETTGVNAETDFAADAAAAAGTNPDLNYHLVMFRDAATVPDSINRIAQLHNATLISGKPGIVIEVSGAPVEYTRVTRAAESAGSITPTDTVDMATAADSAALVTPAAAADLATAVESSDFVTPADAADLATAASSDSGPVGTSLNWSRTLRVATAYIESGLDPRYIRLNYHSTISMATGSTENPTRYNSAVVTEDLSPLHPVIFGLNSSLIDPEYEALLDQNVAYLTKHPGSTVLIQALADNIGNPDYNQWLTARRAAAVRNHYIARGIESGRIIIESLGITGSPCVLQDERQGCSVNRRADTLLLADE
jgi:outer membrane protein OmpA-like peptidoglycan-associated protein